MGHRPLGRPAAARGPRAGQPVPGCPGRAAPTSPRPADQAAGEAGWAARIVEHRVDEVLRLGEGATLRRWLSALPEEVVRARPPAACGPTGPRGRPTRRPTTHPDGGGSGQALRPASPAPGGPAGVGRPIGSNHVPWGPRMRLATSCGWSTWT